jgi:hypothetical protein
MNRAPKQQDRFWSVREIVADPAGAFEYIRELRDSRNTWHRRHDKCEQQLKLARRFAVGEPGRGDKP